MRPVWPLVVALAFWLAACANDAGVTSTASRSRTHAATPSTTTGTVGSSGARERDAVGLGVPGLTMDRPTRLARSCLKLKRTVGRDLCPRAIPRGRLRIDISQPLHGWDRMFGIDLASPALERGAGGRRATAGGHWTIEASGSRGSRRLFALQTHPNSASRASICRDTDIGHERVTVCDVPDHEHGGGYYAGHVVAQWLQPHGNFAVQISAHGYRNRARVIAMIRTAIMQ